MMESERGPEPSDALPSARTAREEYATLFNLAPVGYVALDFAASIVRTNLEASRLLGVEPGQLMGRSFGDFVEASQRGLFLEHVRDSILRGKPTRGEVDVRAANGVARHLHLESVAFAPRVAGRPATLLTVLLDMTESHCAQRERERRERCERQLERMDALGNLAGGVAHDLNNLLTVIMGNASFPVSGSILSTQARFSEIAQAAQRAATFCNDLSAATSHRARDHQRVDLRKLVVDETARLERARSASPRISLSLSDHVLAVAGDPAQLTHALADLVDNAREAYADGDGPVTIRVFRTKATERTLPEVNFGTQLSAGEYVILEVSDHGIGMPPATRDRMFDPFFSDKAPGRGLGLARVCSAARAHAAGVAVDSEPGDGTSIALWFPALTRVTDTRATPPC